MEPNRKGGMALHRSRQANAKRLHRSLQRQITCIPEYVLTKPTRRPLFNPKAQTGPSALGLFS